MVKDNNSRYTNTNSQAVRVYTPTNAETQNYSISILVHFVQQLLGHVSDYLAFVYMFS